MKRQLPLLACEPTPHKKLKEANFLTGRPLSPRYFQLREVRTKLNAWKAQEQLARLLSKYNALVLVGETGSGKTTQIPQFLLEQGFAQGKAIACTQPRRVAAMSVAQRVAEQLDVVLGQEVGYSIRFEEKSSSKTVLKYMTDGMLLREAMTDPLLSKYGVVILDEAHQRTLNTDILLGLLKGILQKRTDLKLIAMSATLQAQKFQAYLGKAPLLTIPGRVYPVEIFYLPEPEDDYLEAAINAAVQIHLSQEPGDILIFLTGEQEIMKAVQEIKAQVQQHDSAGELLVVPLYSALPPNEQQRIFAPCPKNKPGLGPSRKIVVATNIAQTSLTIDGIVYVIDPGFVKQKVFNPRLMVESLLVAPISKASAQQRAGRAGRTRPGKCYRLYTEDSYMKQLVEQTHPEILRTNLAPVILTLKKLGVHDIVHFDFVDPPAPETLMRALELLFYLGSMDRNTNLTDLGRSMAELPLEPMLAKILLTANQFSVLPEVLSLVACLSVPSPFLRPRHKQAEATDAHLKFRHAEGDHLTLLKVFQAYKLNPATEWASKNFLNHRSLKAASDIREQLRGILERQGFPCEQRLLLAPDHVAIRKCLLSGFFTQVASLQRNGVYMTVRDYQIVALHPGSTLQKKPQFVLYNELVLTKKNYMRTVSQIRGEWLFELEGQFFDPERVKQLDIKRELQRAKSAFQNS